MEAKKREKIWALKYTPGDCSADSAIKLLASELGVSDILAALLYNRGYTNTADAVKFLRNEETLFYDPFLLTDMDNAVLRVSAALEKKERIYIFGDYDVDGVTAVSALYLYLKSKNADVNYYIPDRSSEGYGLSVSAIEKLATLGTNLIITVDTGITACDEVEYAKSMGIDMVITDHHECRPELPLACAVVNPHRPDCIYPFKELAGVGVVFKFICAYEIMLCRNNNIPIIDGVRQVCKDYIDLAAIGTIADVMPLKDENRLIVSSGLKLISSTNRVGLRALINAISMGNATKSASNYSTPPKKKKITSGFVGFGIAPRINAAGRISKATIAVDLLLSESENEAQELAEELCEINRARQIEENRIAEQAYLKLEQSLNPQTDHVIVLDDDKWHQGIIGIVASRITEKYGLPSILITYDGMTRGYQSEDDVGKGSGRSVKGINLVGAMTSCSDLLVKYGGHELAAGLSILRSNVSAFRERLNDYIAENTSDNSKGVTFDVDCALTIDEITLDNAAELYYLEPYGISNPTPLFMLEDVVIQKIIPVGIGKHIKLILSRENKNVCAMYFGMQSIKFPFVLNERVDVLFNLDINEFQGVKTVQIIVQDMRLSENFSRILNVAKQQYENIAAGEEFDNEDNIVPTRDDFALLYTAVRRECRLGKNNFSLRDLIILVNAPYELKINYSKLMYMIRIFNELKICRIDTIADDLYRFDMFNNPMKTDIEKSSVLKKLRQRCRNRN